MIFVKIILFENFTGSHDKNIKHMFDKTESTTYMHTKEKKIEDWQFKIKREFISRTVSILLQSYNRNIFYSIVHISIVLNAYTLYNNCRNRTIL